MRVFRVLGFYTLDTGASAVIFQPPYGRSPPSFFQEFNFHPSFTLKTMLQNYIPVIMQAIVALGFCGIMLGMSVLLGKKGKKNPIKGTPYECGMLPVGEGSPRFSIKFYVLAMLFVIFDIEVVFLYPWAAQFRELTAESAMAFWSVCGFVGVLAVAYIYALKKGALTWSK